MDFRARTSFAAAAPESWRLSASPSGQVQNKGSWSNTVIRITNPSSTDPLSAVTMAFILEMSWNCQFAEERQGKRLTAATGGIVVDGTGTPASSVRLILKGERIISDVRLGQFLALAAVRLL
jgi:hypothetical protein